MAYKKGQQVEMGGYKYEILEVGNKLVWLKKEGSRVLHIASLGVKGICEVKRLHKSYV